jgi:hypothetical protein
MAKETGLGWTALNVDDDGAAARDIRNDVTNLEFSTPYAQQDVTGIDKSATERLLLLADFTCTLNGVFNPAANRAHVVLSGDLRVVRTVGITISAQVLNNECLQTDYNLSRNANGEFTWQAPFVLSDGTVPNWT